MKRFLSIPVSGLAVAFFCVFSFVAGASGSGLQPAAPAPKTSGPGIGRPAVAFALKSLDGEPLGLETFRGKPLVINFFATWCDPCREEMPVINELAARAAKEGYGVLGIAVQDSRAALIQYARDANLFFPIALDLNSLVRRSYRIFGPPATFFIDREGIVRDVVLGPITPGRAQEAMAKVGVRR